MPTSVHGEPMETPDALPEKHPAALFSDREWLALFPECNADTGPLDAPPPPDPAAELRDADPLTRGSLVRELRPISASAAAAVALQTLVVPASALFIPLVVVLQASLVLGAVAAWFGNAELLVFGKPQMAAGVAAIALYAALFTSTFTTALLATSLTRFARAAQRPREADASAHPYAPVARWAQLVRAVTESRLLVHDPRDTLCPCPDRSCAGRLPAAAGYWRWADFCVRTAALYTAAFFMLYTSLVTLAPVTWTAWWGVAANVFALANSAFFGAFAIALRFAGNPPARRLLFRLRHRAAVLCLRAMLDRFRQHSGATPSEDIPSDDSYLALHAALGVAWDHRTTPMTSGGYIVAYVVTGFGAGIINASVGSCVPAWCFAIVLQMILTVTVDMVNAASTNEEIFAVSELYARAEAELQLMLPRCADASVRRELAERAAGLAAFARARNSRPRVAGIPADFAVVRTLLISVFTVLVGLWTLLKSAGVAVVLDMACKG